MTKNERIQMVNSLGILSGDQIHQLDEMGFFTAPASTKYHGNYVGGLFDHSWAVMQSLIDMTVKMNLEWKNPASPMIVGLFHDLCKCDNYVVSMSTEDGVEFDYNNNILLKGHGEKSVMLLSNMMTLTDEEILCIRYHMGAYNTDEWDLYDRAIRSYQNVLWTHTADMFASKVMGV